MDPELSRRLALVRLLLARAEGDSAQPGPFAGDSVNRLHDVAEMFLAFAAGHHNLKIPAQFDQYWDVLDRVLGRPLQYRTAMQAFNKARVNLKHYGIEPSAQAVRDGRAAVRGLINDECEPLFGVDISAVSLANFVASDDARAWLNAAERHMSLGDELEAFGDLSEAFHAVISDYGDRKLTGSRRSILDSVEDINALRRRMPVPAKYAHESHFDQGVLNALESLNHSIKLVGLGVDLRRYGKFAYLMPYIRSTMDGGRQVMADPVPREPEAYDFCRDFVITTALHLAEFDYEFDVHELYREGAELLAQQQSANVQTEPPGGP